MRNSAGYRAVVEDIGRIGPWGGFQEVGPTASPMRDAFLSP